MSLTSVSTLSSVTSANSTGSNCPNCGIKLSSHSHQEIPKDAQRRIEELEAQVKILTSKATAAVDKLADYEDELQKLKTSQTMNQPSSANLDDLPPPNSTRGSGGSSVLASTQNRLSSFLAARKSSPHLAKDASTQPELSTQELQRALSQEQKLRQKAEGQLSQASGELEELSASLFQQANEMVATERKARAKLEERVLVLEKRDGEKRVRLERLEKAVARIERVRGVLAGGPGQ